MMNEDELNWRLAEALGWTNLFHAGDVLMGLPPAGGAHCRGQAPIPDWRGDWAACGPLMVAHLHEINIDNPALFGQGAVCIDDIELVLPACAAPGSRDEVVRKTIVLAVIARLEGKR